MWGYFYFDSRIMVDVGGQRSPQEIYFGADSRIDDPSRFVIPIELIAGVYFTLVTLIFLGLGQEMGRRFSAIRDPLSAYTADVLGSLTGIAAFAVMSFWHVPSRFWFADQPWVLGFTSCLVAAFGHAAAAVAVFLIVATRIDTPKTAPGQTAINTWSPYNLVSYKSDRRWIDVNNLAHQGMHPIDQSGPAYLLPHLLNRDAGNPPFRGHSDHRRGIGAMTLAAALEQGATYVDCGRD